MVLLVHHLLLLPIAGRSPQPSTLKHKVGGWPHLQALEPEVISSMVVHRLTSRVVHPLTSMVVLPLIMEATAVEAEEDMGAGEVVAVVAADEAALLHAGFSLLPMDVVMGTVADFRTLAKTVS